MPAAPKLSMHVHTCTHFRWVVQLLEMWPLAFYRHVEIDCEINPTDTQHSDASAQLRSDKHAQITSYCTQGTSEPSKAQKAWSHFCSGSAVDAVAVKALVPTHCTTGEVKTRATGTAKLWEGGAGETEGEWGYGGENRGDGKEVKMMGTNLTNWESLEEKEM